MNCESETILNQNAIPQGRPATGENLESKGNTILEAAITLHHESVEGQPVGDGRLYC